MRNQADLAGAPDVQPRIVSKAWVEGQVLNRLRTSVVLPWIIAVVGFPIGGLLAQTIAGPAATVPAAIVSGLIAGAVIGLAQGIALWLRGRTLVLWVVATAVALAVALAAVTAVTGQPGTSADAIVLGAVSGLLIGAAQAGLLRRAGIANARVWVVVTGVARAFGWLITAGVGVALAPGWPVYGASGALVSQLITAAALWWLVPSRGALSAAA